MEPTSNFILDGKTFYQQTRKCGSPTCKCAEGEEHGPYWYSRTHYGQVKYIGKQLPEPIKIALEISNNYRKYAQEQADLVRTQLRSLQLELDALENFLYHRQLSAQDLQQLKNHNIETTLLV